MRFKLGSTYIWTTMRGLLRIDATDASTAGGVWAAADCPVTRTASRMPGPVNLLAIIRMRICRWSATLVPLNLGSTSGISRQAAYARYGIVLSLTKADDSAP